MTHDPDRESRCYICRAPLPAGPGAVYHAGLGIRYCRAHADLVHGAERVHDRSARGRWRSRGAVLAILRGYREAVA